MPDPMIAMHNLCFSYQDRKAFCFELTVVKGEKIWIHGPSGAGKTTLFKLLLGFEQPLQGELRIMGERLTPANVYALRQKMAYVPQHPALGRGELWEIFKEIFAFSANRHLTLDRRELVQYFEDFGLPAELLAGNFAELSGGEQQRVSIVLSLLLKREILLLDEAVAAIDPKQRRLILQKLAESNCTILLIAHDPPGLKAFKELDFKQIITSN